MNTLTWLAFAAGASASAMAVLVYHLRVLAIVRQLWADSHRDQAALLRTIADEGWVDSDELRLAADSLDALAEEAGSRE